MLAEMSRSENPEKRHFDYDKIEEYGVIYLSVEDMALDLNTSKERIQKLMNRPNSMFYKRYHKGLSKATICVWSAE